MAKYRKRKIKLNLKDESFQSSLGVALLVFAALVTLSFFGQAAGAGNFLQDLLNKLFGWGTFLIPILAAISGLVLLRLRIKIPFVEIRTIYGLGLLTIALLGLMHFFIPEERPLRSDFGPSRRIYRFLRPAPASEDLFFGRRLSPFGFRRRGWDSNYLKHLH